MEVKALQEEISELKELLQKVEAKKAALTNTLDSYIVSYFRGLVSGTSDSEKRREYASFLSSKQFDIVDNDQLVFFTSDRAGRVFHKVSVKELLQAA